MKASISAYAPQILKTYFENPEDRIASYTGTLGNLVRNSFEKALQNLRNYLPESRVPSVLHAYLSVIGFNLPSDNNDRIQRFFDGYRMYLKKRGTLDGVRLLSFLVTGFSPQVERLSKLSSNLRLSGISRCGKTRLHDCRIAYVRLHFEPSIDLPSIQLLRRLMDEDRPPNVRFLISR